MPETVLYDDAERTVTETTSPGWPTQVGSTRSVRTTWKVENEITRRVAISDGIVQGLATMQQIIDTPDVAFTTVAGAQTAMRQMQTAIKAEARQLRRLSRLALGLLDGTD